MRIINWVLLWLCSTFNLWKKIIGTKFRIRAWFYLMKTIPKIWIFPLFLAKQRSPLARPLAAWRRPCVAGRRPCAAARGCASPPGFGWEGGEREREMVGWRRREFEREKRVRVWVIGELWIFTEKKEISPLRFSRKRRSFNKKALNNLILAISTPLKSCHLAKARIKLILALHLTQPCYLTHSTN